ncbi:MAG: aldo/keto reductase [Calditrichia bacterium]
MTVERCELAPGLSISRILTGLWQIADMERDGSEINPDTAAEFMTPYTQAGLTTFDMADHYGSSEIITGRYQKKYGKDSVQLFTKWVPKPENTTKQDVRDAIQLSLDRMQSDQLDLLQFHAWNYANPDWLDCLYWLQELKEEGLIRHLGLTNFDTAHLRIVLTSGIDVVTNQVCFSLIDRRPERAMTALCEEFNVKLLCYGTVAGGFLSDRWLNNPEPDWDNLTTWSQMKYGRFIAAAGGWKPLQTVLSAADTIAKKHSVSVSNVACRYILDQPGVGGVIIGARLGISERIADNLKLFTFQMDAGDRELLANALAELQTIPGDSGDEYRKPPFLTASGDLSHHLEKIPAPYEAIEKNGRQHVLSGTYWEEMAGFCRAVKNGNRIAVSGTTATHGKRAIGGNDVAAQTHFIIDKIEGALQSFGSSLQDVVRTRIFVRDIADWEAAARAHGERFADIQPANTLVEAKLVGEEYLVEIEAEAIARS